MDELKEKLETSTLEVEGEVAEEEQPYVYCGVCHMPPEFCEFMPSFPKCQEWLLGNHPDLHSLLYSSDNADGVGSSTVQTASSKRGGKAQVRDESVVKEKQAQARAQAQITIRRQDRNKRKTLTIVKGLDEAVGLDLKKVAKRLAGKFACGAAVTEDVTKQGHEITIQGDVGPELMDFLPLEYSINPEQIHFQ